MSRESYRNAENDGFMQWTLWREDIYGNQYRMPLQFNDEDEALLALDGFTAKGHHQTYFTKQLPIEDEIDFIPAKEK